MSGSRQSTVNWEKDIYAKGSQINKWPFSDLVSTVLKITSKKVRSNIVILEIGCGTCNNIWFLASEGFDTHGIDMSKTAIQYGQKRLQCLGLKADLKVGDISKLPWPNSKFDIVIDRGALTHNNHENIREILNEAYRVLKLDGMIISSTLYGLNHPDRAFGKELSYHAFDKFTQGYFKNVGLTSFFNAEDLQSLFANFKQVEISRHTTSDGSGDIRKEAYSLTAFK
jgi:ubiquinone/menaquinone biosynthesis C-methylase UbiE